MSEAQPPEFAPSFFDLASVENDTGFEAGRICLDALASRMRANTDWVIETAGDGAVSLEVDAVSDGAISARLVMGETSIDIGLAVLDTGWIEIVGQLSGVERFRAYLDRPFEEFELWPASAPTRGDGKTDAPGRIGKRGNWISFSVAHLPELEPWANAHGFVAAMAAER